MLYIAALDYDHLDNGVFLTTLARSLYQQQSKNDLRAIILHGDSAYTERIMQSGVMREEARIRSIKDLNHRLIALFADQGVSTIGINPYQKNFIELKNEQLLLDHSFLEDLPRQPVLLLSTLIQDTDRGQTRPLELTRLSQFLFQELPADRFFIFAKSEESEIFASPAESEEMNWEGLDQGFRSKQIPDDLINLNLPVDLTTARDFNQVPELKNTISIR